MAISYRKFLSNLSSSSQVEIIFIIFFSLKVALSFIFQNPNLYNSGIHVFYRSWNSTLAAYFVLMAYCPESCICKAVIIAREQSS